MKQKIFYMSFGIVWLRRKCGCMSFQLINKTGSLLTHFKYGYLLIYFATCICRSVESFGHVSLDLIAWQIWKNRNLYIFQNITWSSLEIIKTSFSWLQQFKSSQRFFKAYSPNLCHHSHTEGRWVHLFSDCCMERVIRRVATGGVLRDKDGN